MNILQLVGVAALAAAAGVATIAVKSGSRRLGLGAAIAFAVGAYLTTT